MVQLVHWAVEQPPGSEQQDLTLESLAFHGADLVLTLELGPVHRMLCWFPYALGFRYWEEASYELVAPYLLGDLGSRFLTVNDSPWLHAMPIKNPERVVTHYCVVTSDGIVEVLCQRRPSVVVREA